MTYDQVKVSSYISGSLFKYLNYIYPVCLVYSLLLRSFQFFLKCQTKISKTLNLCLQVVSCRLQMTDSLLQKTVKEQGDSEAIGDKLVNKAVTLMDNIGALVDR